MPGAELAAPAPDTALVAPAALDAVVAGAAGVLAALVVPLEELPLPHPLAAAAQMRRQDRLARFAMTRERNLAPVHYRLGRDEEHGTRRLVRYPPAHASHRAQTIESAAPHYHQGGVGFGGGRHDDPCRPTRLDH
jgi:hypothetical protein